MSWNNVNAKINGTSNYLSAFGHGPEFLCTGEWDEDSKKAYDEQMSYYSDPANAPVACQEFADGFRQGMDYFVPQDDDHEEFNKQVTTTAHSIGGPSFHKDAAVCESLVHVDTDVYTGSEKSVKTKKALLRQGSCTINQHVHGKGLRHCMIYFHGGGGVAGTPKQH